MENEDRNQSRDKELTKRKLIQAVGHIILEKGYAELGINKIARKADVDKKLIYRYFKNLETLLETYISEKDFWISSAGRPDSTQEGESAGTAKQIISELLVHHFHSFYHAPEMQKIVLEEISKARPLLSHISAAREKAAAKLIMFADRYFADTTVDIRATIAMVASGIYFFILHAKTNSSTIGGMDINTTSGRETMVKAIRQIIDGAFSEAARQKKDL